MYESGLADLVNGSGEVEHLVGEALLAGVPCGWISQSDYHALLLSLMR